jgi:triacylglycerol esterase/lipase EstA (alpha/beta hydrolase family)
VLLFLIEVLAAAVVAYHGFTSLLWLYEKRRHGTPSPRGLSVAGVVAWIGEGLALLLAIVVWPLGLLPGRAVAPGGVGRPVVLVHGWAMNRSSMFVLAARLRRDGRRVYTVNYNGLAAKSDDKACELASNLERIRRESGAERIDFVAHSLGGILLRAVAKYHGGLDYFGNVVTLGSPHRGTALAVMFRRYGLIELRPGSPFLERLAEEDPIAARKVNFTSIYSAADYIVFPTDCSFYPPAFNAELDGIGHMGMLLSERVYDLVKENLDADLAS